MKAYKKTNLAYWNEMADRHVDTDGYQTAAFRKGANILDPIVRKGIGNVRGKKLLHLQCHFGLDTLCWARLGARVTGIDFSTVAIGQARALAEEVGLAARFVESDIDGLPGRLTGEFDVVYTSRGVLGWLPDLERWGRVVAHFVRPGGFFYITEIHPMAQVFADDDGVHDLRLRYPYFSQPKPISLATKGSYADREAHVNQEVEYGWSHGLGEIVTALTTAGLHIEFLHEVPVVEWPVSFLQAAADGTYRLPPGTDGELPLFFSLKASKP